MTEGEEEEEKPVAVATTLCLPGPLAGAAAVGQAASPSPTRLGRGDARRPASSCAATPPNERRALWGIYPRIPS
jgi:hypothetical protein